MIQDLKNIKIRFGLELFLHVLAWGSLCLFIWHTVNTIGPFRKQDGSIYLPLIWSTSFNAVLFYVNGLYLIPLFIKKQQFKKYTFWVVLLFITIVVLNSIFDQQYSISLFSSEKETFLSDVIMNTQSKTMILSLSIGYGLTRQWFKNQELQQKLIQDNLKTQLKYLKAQINPHFLFNTLNMAFASATKSQDVVTANIVEKLSGLMRYVLYESNEDKVFLEKEISYIDNTVSLQLQRLSSELAGQVNYQVEGDWQNHKIAPMILIPFIENVFKHGTILSQRSDISISIVLEENILTLETRNAKSGHFIKKDPNSGIGLKNARERLQLLYPGKHKLDINDAGSYFQVRLQIVIN